VTKPNHTIPWNDYELITVNGLKLCYEWVNDEMIVKFPGNNPPGGIPLGLLKLKRVFRFVPPEIVRRPE
jgi:hypothetical protein